MRARIPLLWRACMALALACAAAGCQSSAPTPEAAPAELALRRADLEGASLDLDAALARGETVALVFWQTWCESCRDEAPAIRAAAAAQAGKIHFVGVVPGKTGVVDEEEVAKTRAAWGYTFSQVRDADMSWTRALQVKGTPTILVLGAERKVLYNAHRPPADWSRFAGAAFSGKPLASSSAKAPSASSDQGSASGSAECEDGVCPLPADDAPRTKQ